MRARLSRRGLSPLIATVVLISATVVGGLLVYNYFQRSMDSVATTSSTLALTVRSEYLTTTSKLVYIEATNFHDVPVNIAAVWVVYENGTHAALAQADVKGLPAQVEPGDKATIIARIPSDAVSVYLEYQANGKTLYTNPEPVK